MKTDLKTLQDLVKISYEQYEESRKEEREVRNLFHNRQYDIDQLAELEERGQPAETFNIIKLFSRVLIGYYSTVVNTITVKPKQFSDLDATLLLNDVIQYTFESNHFETEGDKIKLDGILSGLMCVYIDVVATGKLDNFGRPIRRIELSHVPIREILIDPESKKEDYSDARYIHRFKWVSEDFMRNFLKSRNKNHKQIMSKLEEYYNHIMQEDAEFHWYYNDRFIGYNKEYESYLLLHSIITDDKNDTWSIYWCGEEILDKQKITYNKVKFPYRVQKLQVSDIAEYYGIFREVKESQKAINQAILKIQLMANTHKVLVRKGAVDDINEFKRSYERVNSITEINIAGGIETIKNDREIAEQYVLIEKAFDRIQRILGVNDSFLGIAFASDSGRKVKLQQDATTVALRYLTTKIEQFYRMLGLDIANLIQQFYTANEIINIADEAVGDRWVELNKPIEIPTGQVDQFGQPEIQIPYEEVLDENSGEPVVNAQGIPLIQPVSTSASTLDLEDIDIKIDSTPYNDEDESNQLLVETIIQGPIGQALMQVNPSAYLRVASLSVKGLRTKNSPIISRILEEVSMQLEQQYPGIANPYPGTATGGAGRPPAGQEQVDSPRSESLKLPQNTNEGLPL